MEKENKIEELKDKVSDVFENIAEKVGEEKDTKKKKLKPLVSSRVLFVTVLDKIYFAGLFLTFILSIIAYVNVRVSWNIYGASYFGSLFSFIVGLLGILIGFVIAYLILNWLYKCVEKTMVCMTRKEVYGEFYAPFYRGELSIPIDKITRIDTVKVFWIFRTLIIHRYHQIPIVFPTWNAQEFKDKWTEVVMDRDEKVENEFETRSIIPAWLKKKWLIIVIALAAVLVLATISFTVRYLDDPIMKIPGTYVFDDQKIILTEDGMCELENISDYEVTDCGWSIGEFYNNTLELHISYSYRYKYSWSNRYYTSDSSTIAEFDNKNETLEFDWNTFRKVNK